MLRTIWVMTVIMLASAAVDARSRTDDRRLLLNSEMRELIGGVCNTKCWNNCSDYEECQQLGSCHESATEGERCAGGGGGEGTVYTCASVTASTECEINSSSTATSCTPTHICTCNAQHVCTESQSVVEKSGREECNTGDCSS